MSLAKEIIEQMKEKAVYVDVPDSMYDAALDCLNKKFNASKENGRLVVRNSIPDAVDAYLTSQDIADYKISEDFIGESKLMNFRREDEIAFQGAEAPNDNSKPMVAEFTVGDNEIAFVYAMGDSGTNMVGVNVTDADFNTESYSKDVENKEEAEKMLKAYSVMKNPKALIKKLQTNGFVLL